jgi:hypothetical protein
LFCASLRLAQFSDGDGISRAWGMSPNGLESEKPAFNGKAGLLMKVLEQFRRWRIEP